jgi:hypothetical protein
LFLPCPEGSQKIIYNRNNILSKIIQLITTPFGGEVYLPEGLAIVLK